MKAEHVLEGLKHVAQQLGIQIRSEKGSFRGGRCIVGGEEVIVLNRHQIPEVQITVLAQSLSPGEVDNVYMRPALRKALELAWERSEVVPEGFQENE